MDVTTWNLWVHIGLVALMTGGRYLFEKLLSRFLKALKVEGTNAQMFAKSIVMVAFNLIVLLLFGLLKAELVALANVERGLIVVAVGLVMAILVSLLSYAAIRAGYGEGYGALAARSTLDKVFAATTFLVLVGPAEDLFFVGFVQNLLTARLGWVSIVVYVVTFTLYHVANVLSGVEKKEEFLGALPIRLTVAALLGVSFYATHSLLYGLVVHNAVDTLSYAALLMGVKHRQANPPVEPDN
ncbi:MAG: CPBP family intramembrane metalloprotease [Anaerolineae bacterium]|nr:CPBP family intramembrane metalloprotease [Anaerolineae bacterium]